MTPEEFREFARFWEAHIRTDRDLHEFVMHLKVVVLEKQIRELGQLPASSSPTAMSRA